MTLAARFGVELDHLVVGAGSLEAGAAWLEARLGVPMQSGGTHQGWGTHNRLLRLGGGAYLELIALDPAQASPEHPPLFGLALPETRVWLRERPRLMHWVLRCRDLDGLVAALRAHPRGYDPGEPVPMARGDLRWRITVPRPEALAARFDRPGLLRPTLIEWGFDDPALHPAARLAPSGVELRRLGVIGCGDRAPVDELLQDKRALTVAGTPTALIAELSTPRDVAFLD